MSPVSSTACICKGQIRDWSHQGQNSPLCSPPIHHSLICNIINELMCRADFINIHWREITKVSLEVFGCSKKSPKAICEFCRSDRCFVLHHEHCVETASYVLFQVIALKRMAGESSEVYIDPNAMLRKVS